MTAADLTLFLDFDGVLHPVLEVDEATGDARNYRGPHFVSATTLVELLRPYLADIEIVISSNWAKKRDLNTLRGLLPAEIAERVTDAVHHHLQLRAGTLSRWSEIAWYRQHIRPFIGERWFAIDDDDWHWPIDQRHHLAFCHDDLAHADSQQAVRDALARFGFDLFYVAKKLREKEIQSYKDNPNQPNPVMVPARAPGVEVEIVWPEKHKP